MAGPVPEKNDTTSLGKKFDGDPRYSKDIPGNIKKADQNWKTIRAVPVNKL